jgi:hypothetical protein
VNLMVYDPDKGELLLEQPLQLDKAKRNEWEDSYLGPLGLETRRYFFKVAWFDPAVGPVPDVPLAGAGPRSGMLEVTPDGACRLVP